MILRERSRERRGISNTTAVTIIDEKAASLRLTSIHLDLRNTFRMYRRHICVCRIHISQSSQLFGSTESTRGLPLQAEQHIARAKQQCLSRDRSVVFVLLLVLLRCSLLQRSRTLSYKLRRTIFDEFRVVIETGPFRQSIWNIDDTLGVEHVTSTNVSGMNVHRQLETILSTHRGLKFSRSFLDLKCIKEGNSRIMFLPSSMIGLWQNEQRTLHGNLCSAVFSVGSYHSRWWWPLVKLISSL